MVQPRLTRMIPPVFALVLLAPLLAGTVSAQQATPASTDTIDPAALTDAIASAGPPADLPGNNDTAIELVAWEDHFGEGLANTEGAWVLTGSPELPLATVIVFGSSEDAQTGIAGYQAETSSITVGGLDAWTVADRGKWICVTAAGSMIVIGQAFPERGDEPQEDVEQRSCAVLEATLDWLHSDVIGAPVATPSASPTSEPDN